MFIVPIDNELEVQFYVSKMYCLNCKERGGCSVTEKRDAIENVYHYEIVTCLCKKCSSQFNVTFFNTSSKINKKLKDLQKIYSYNFDKLELFN